MAANLPMQTEREVAARVWVMSDLQTDDPDVARRCLTTAIADFDGIYQRCDQLWNLGDAVAGTDVERNRAVAGVQLELLNDLGLPSRYVMGNHDIDPPRYADDPRMPFYEAVREDPGWRTTDDAAAFQFVGEVGEHVVLFLSDHVDVAAGWAATHGRIRGDADAYPYTERDYRAAIEAVAARDRPIIIAGHNAFAGGNRAAGLQDRFMPLPPETVIHLYGHAHIGDERNVPSDSGRNAYRTLSYVDNHRIPQIDISSLEDGRGDVVRSAILETYADGAVSVHLRDHSHGRWLESYASHGPQEPYVARLGDRTFSALTHGDLLLAVIEYLDAEHDLFAAIELPYRVTNSNISIAETPTHPDGTQMRQPEELPNGWYLEGGLHKYERRDTIAAFAEACGLAATFDGHWT